MKARGIIDFYFPGSVVLHLKVLLGGVLFSIAWSLFTGQADIFSTQFLFRTALILIQLEIGFWLGFHIIGKKQIKLEKGYTKKLLLRLLLFYLIVGFVSALIFVLLIFFSYVKNGYDLTSLPGNLMSESRGWLIGATVGIMIGTLIFFYFQWQVALKNEQKLREQNLVFQYETIRNQVNPHFLFNSLNTLSSLINGNESAEKFIHKLSSIYRYVLENSNVERVDLDQEINFIKDYFSLQKIRDEEKVILDIHPIKTKKFQILPISLQILVENALKHNTATRDNPLRIIIYPEDDYIAVKNNLRKKLNIEDSPGTGLRNLGERLKLITQKEMKVIETKEEYIVKIPLIPV